jgi:hypothetical protein
MPKKHFLEKRSRPNRAGHVFPIKEYQIHGQESKLDLKGFSREKDCVIEIA